MVSYGAVICNHEGLVMLLGADVDVYFDDVNVVEEEALCFGLRLARKTGLSPLIIEFNSLYVIQLIQGRQSTRIDLFWITVEIQQLVIPKHDFRIQHVSRNCN